MFQRAFQIFKLFVRFFEKVINKFFQPFRVLQNQKCFRISVIQKTLSEAKGGWKALIWAGGAVSAVTGVIGFVMGHWGK